MPMTGMARQREAFQNADARMRRLLAAASLLLASVAAAAQTTPTIDPAHAQPPAGTRGVSAQAAREAVAAQVEQAVPKPAEAGSPTADAATVPPADTVSPAVAPVTGIPRLRGVMFRVTPPTPALLPAEIEQAAAPPAGEAATAPASPAAVPPPRPSYLLGTIHFGTPEEQGIDYAQIERLMGEAETFVNEANLDEAWKPEYDGYRWLPVETPLAGMIGKDAITQANALLPQVRPQDLQRMKPWSVLALLEARGESGGEATMDARLQRMASGAGKRMAHLETLEQQLQALDCVPASEHSMVLAERLRGSWILRIESAEAMAFYRGRNLDAWLASIDEMEGLGEQAKAIEHRSRRCLLEDRNARWIGQLETLFQDGPCLVAVGAVHLVGEDGLLAALRRDGYTIEAVPL
jgi:uncharacterized protein YbaP (TraB family)